MGSAAIAVGLGRGALAAAMAYAKQRRQFGQAVADFQAIQWKLADMATDLEAAGLLTLKAAWLKDQEAALRQAAAMAKKFATDTAMAAATEGVQILGGYGCLTDSPWNASSGTPRPGRVPKAPTKSCA